MSKAAVATPETAPKAEKTVMVRVLRSHPDLGYFGGEVVEVPTELFDQYKGDADTGPFLEKA